jgi:ankyrin repeat protein
LLLKNNAQINKPDHKGFTPLHAAAQEGHSEIVAHLLLNGANANEKNVAGYTPLHSTFINNSIVPEIRLKIARMLLESSVEVNTFTKYGFLPIHLAIEQVKDKNIFEQIVSLLVKNGADINQEIDLSIKKLVPCWNEIPKHKWPAILANPTDSKQKIKGISLLHFAVLDDNKGAVEILLARGAQITNSFLGFDYIELAKALERAEILELLKNQPEILNSQKLGATMMF